MRNIFVKPAVAGAVVPDEQPPHRPLKAEGEFKPETSYWVRRLRDKDVVETDPPRATATVAAVEAGPAIVEAVEPEPAPDKARARR